MAEGTDFRPYCGTEYPPERVLGDPMVCDLPPHDVEQVKHQNSESGFSWWDC